MYLNLFLDFFHWISFVCLSISVRVPYSFSVKSYNTHAFNIWKPSIFSLQTSLPVPALRGALEETKN